MNIRNFSVACAVAAACTNNTAPQAPMDTLTSDGPGAVIDRTTFVDACTSFNHPCMAMDGADCGKCQYRFKVDPAHCSAAAPCDHLVLVWANLGCDGDGIDKLFDAVLARSGYVAACAQPLYPGELLPASLGAPERENAVIGELFAALRATGAWSGKNLLMVGCSMGASRYPVVAARYPDDAQWVGTHKTAACLSDGVISLAYQDTFVGEAIGSGGMSCAARHSRIARAYTVQTPSPTHSCSGSPQGQCACDDMHASRLYPGDCGDGDCVAFDSIVKPSASGFTLAPGVTAASFAVPHWRLFGEGAAFRDTPQRCDRDVVPEEPMHALCDALDADPAHACTFVSQPDAPHCATFSQSLGSACLDWFESLP